jgi:3-hydroxypropionate dehydrogenase (NADP+)
MTRKVACVGAGLIGHSWAALFAMKGFQVALEDANGEAVDHAMRWIRSDLDVLVENGFLSKEEADGAVGRIEPTVDLAEALDGSFYVQESALERYDVKKPLFKEMDRLTHEDVILASSSSALLMTEIQAVTSAPRRCIVAHPWNPPLLIPLVEVVSGKDTSMQTIEETRRLMLELGKCPVVLKKEVPGYIGNRLQAALWREAIDLVDKGVCAVEDIDNAVSKGPGLRWAIMGPNLTFHLGGGPKGIEYFIEHIGPSYDYRLMDMASWTSIPESGAKKVIEGVRSMPMVQRMSVEELAQWRDRRLLKILKVLSET